MVAEISESKKCSKRGRPSFKNPASRRTKTMTICLSEKTKKKLVAKAESQKPALAPATMASFIIEKELS